MSTNLKIKSSNMSLLNSFVSGFTTNSSKPFSNQFLNDSYELLFCDNASLYKNDITIPLYPWDVLFSDDGSLSKIKTIASNPEIESRPRLIAHKLMADAGLEITERELMGIVVELHHKNKIDVLAAYADNSLYYIHHNERLINLNSKSERQVELIEKLFRYGNRSFHNFNINLKKRGEVPATGHARITLLTSMGNFTAEGVYSNLRNDLHCGTIIETAVQLMLFLTEQRQRQLKKDFGKLAS